MKALSIKRYRHDSGWELLVHLLRTVRKPGYTVLIRHDDLPGLGINWPWERIGRSSASPQKAMAVAFSASANNVSIAIAGLCASLFW